MMLCESECIGFLDGKPQWDWGVWMVSDHEDSGEVEWVVGEEDTLQEYLSPPVERIDSPKTIKERCRSLEYCGSFAKTIFFNKNVPHFIAH